jgi:hypothetical protein
MKDKLGAAQIRQNFWVLIFIFCTWGCTSRMAVSNSTTIGTDANGFAVGQYSDSRSGEIQSPISTWFGGGGGGGGSSNSSGLGAALLGPLRAAASAGSSAGSSAGAGAIGGGFSSGTVESQGDPMKFARAIAMINYSRRLEIMSVDSPGGSRDYTFTDKPLKKRNYQPFGQQTD